MKNAHRFLDMYDMYDMHQIHWSLIQSVAFMHVSHQSGFPYDDITT